MGSMPNLDTNETVGTPTAKTESQAQTVGDDALSQAMLRVFERVTKAQTRSDNQGPVTERLWSNGTKLFKGVTKTTPTVTEYWLEAIERIMNNLDCTPKQKLKCVVSLLRDKAYQWWQLVEQGTQPERVIWAFFQSAFQKKYVGTRYIEARRLQFIKRTQADKTVANYEDKFQRLGKYTYSLVVGDYDKNAHFENRLHYDLKLLVAP